MMYILLPIVAVVFYKFGQKADERARHKKLIKDWIFNIERPDIK